VCWENAGPLVTGVVRCDLVVRGPVVAPVWPQARGWKARPGMLRRWRSSGRLSTIRCCPWGIVRDRCYGRAKSMAGEDEPDWGVTAVVTHLNRRVRPVLDDHCLVGKRPKAARQKAFSLGRRSPLRHWSG
jgi:hypothetical protein